VVVVWDIWGVSVQQVALCCECVIFGELVSRRWLCVVCVGHLGSGCAAGDFLL